ncbi:MAG TPA: phage tail protein [Gemmatimonadales bacterium]|nr:phage tail protein [Gemmatimonadales bacterium]
MERRNFLKGLVALPFAGKMLAGMDWAAMAPAEASAAGMGGYSCVVPPGTILPFVGEGAPPGFLPCDGRLVTKAAYPKLHSAIGDAFGAERWFGVKRMRVPDLRASARPAAAIRADQHAIEFGTPPIYAMPEFQYVIRT